MEGYSGERLRGVIPYAPDLALDLAPDPAFVSHARAVVTDQLTAWGLGELAFTTGLVAGEPITHACATPPARCDSGRDLFLVAQLTERWGTRCTAADGKIIWTEQRLP